MQNSKSKKRWIWILLVVILIIILVTVFAVIASNTNKNAISETTMQRIIREEAEYVANQSNKVPDSKKAQFKGKDIDSFTVTAYVGSNTVYMQGILRLSNSTVVKYTSEWVLRDYSDFYGQRWYDYDKSTSAYQKLTDPSKGHYNYFAVASDDANASTGSKNALLSGGLQAIDREYVPAWKKSALWGLIPAFIILIPIIYLMYQFSKNDGGFPGMNPFGGTKNRARLTKSDVKFSDVAGITEEKDELVELVDYLKNPQKYAVMGARAPKGVLLEGPPGTGKTLLAKAVAGEAGVPFFIASGSEFEEMFVGLGASRIRDLFSEAKKNAPCIIFMDEIDAVGRKRSSLAGPSTTEQTINQLLVELDGFGTNIGVIVIAATNRADVLDPALLRPGRFDRQIQMSLPDIAEREAILKLHARNKNVSSEVDFGRIAERTPGFSGAQLENVLNEAALLSVRENKKIIDVSTIDEAIDRVIGGPAKKSREYTVTDKDTVSYHEAGHALIGLKLDAASKVQKVTIIPRGQAGGYTIMTPREETKFQSKENLYATITGYLGGRASEELLFGKTRITTGAHDDLDKATNIARHMVTEYGMSSLGLVQYESTRDMYAGTQTRWWSEEVAAKIDIEIHKILDSCYQAAIGIVSAHRPELDLIAESLRILETITAEQIEYIDKHMELPKEVLAEKARRAAREQKKQNGEILELKPKQRTSSSTVSKPESDIKPETKKATSKSIVDSQATVEDKPKSTTDKDDKNNVNNDDPDKKA